MDKLLSQPAIKISFITAIVTLALAGLKIFFGYAGESHALVADGFHSLADVLVALLVLFAAHYGTQKADHNHPYGHGRIETAATFGLALILILTGLGIMSNAGVHLWGHEPIPKPELITLWIAIITTVVNEILFQVTYRISKKINSDMLAANAWHSRSDAWVSIVVILGILGAIAGYRYLDVIGALIVGLMIIKLGGELGWKSISELVDTGADEKTLAKIKQLINEVPGVCTLHMLRTRTIKNNILVDVHILVSPHISVSEGHFIGDQVWRSLKKLPEITDVTVHVDPEDDELMHFSSALPDRKTLEPILHNQLKHMPYANNIKFKLHYLNGKIEVDLFVPVIFLRGDDFNQLSKEYTQAINHISDISRISVYFYPA
ncbi:MAG: cation diffusion facilitator family transporter [Gammaproteobacteria bacterium]|nr:cation diffusion facilitator family transporter [Gammaproteobacteria bacterium]